MLIGIENLYSSNTRKCYIKKGWYEHYEKMGLSATKLSHCVERKMRAGKIPPQLKGKQVKVICVDERPKRHYFITL